MEIVEKTIGELKPYKNNPRLNEGAVDMVAESIKAFGFKVPVVIDKNCEIVAGHTRYEAAKKLKLKKIPCIVAEDLSDEQVRAFRIADNKTSDFSIWDNKLLLEELSELGEDLFTGFITSDDFDDVLDESDKDAVYDNENGVEYEVVFRSDNNAIIDAMVDYWESLNHD